MGANASRDALLLQEPPAAHAEDQAAHPMRRSRLGSRPMNDPLAPPLAPFLPLPPSDASAAFARLTQAHAHAAPVPHRSPVQRSGIVANVVNLDKATLRVSPAPDDPAVLLLLFRFTANVPGFISVYYAARRMVHRASGVTAPVRKVSYLPLEVGGNGDGACAGDGGAGDGAGADGLRSRARKSEKTRFEAGTRLQYRQKAARGLDTRLYPHEALTEVVDGVQYPVVIRIEARHTSGSAKGPRRSRVTSQSTHAVLTREPGGEWGIKVVSQEVLIGGTIYVIQELYGIGAVDVTASRSAALASDSGVPNVFDVDKANECVICLTEAANTAVLPCNHLCLCQECGKKLSEDPAPDRRRCPICRTEIESLLRIIPTSLSTARQRSVAGGESKQSLELENVSSGEGEAPEADSAGADSPPLAAAPPSANPPTEQHDAASISSEVSDSSSREEDGAVVRVASASEPRAAAVPSEHQGADSEVVSSERGAAVSSEQQAAAQADDAQRRRATNGSVVDR